MATTPRYHVLEILLYWDGPEGDMDMFINSVRAQYAYDEVERAQARANALYAAVPDHDRCKIVVYDAHERKEVNFD